MDLPQILVVDDHPEIRFLIKAQLKKLGRACDAAEDGLDAFERYQSHHYPLLFMDLAMPRLDGIEATKKIRDYEQATTSPRSVIIAVTGQGERSECLSAGMDDFTEKPVLIDTMRSLLERWLPVSA